MANGAARRKIIGKPTRLLPHGGGAFRARPDQGGRAAATWRATSPQTSCRPADGGPSAGRVATRRREQCSIMVETFAREGSNVTPRRYPPPLRFARWDHQILDLRTADLSERRRPTAVREQRAEFTWRTDRVQELRDDAGTAPPRAAGSDPAAGASDRRGALYRRQKVAIGHTRRRNGCKTQHDEHASRISRWQDGKLKIGGSSSRCRGLRRCRERLPRETVGGIGFRAWPV